MKKSVTTKGGKVSIDTGPLAALKAEIAANKGKRVHVGVLGGNDARAEEPGKYTPGNAEIGKVHEFGMIGGISPVPNPGESKQPEKKGRGVTIPERSFLRMPLMAHLPDAIKKTGKQFWRDSIVKDGIGKTLRRLGVLGEGVVQDAFATGGFGTWPKLSRRTIKAKGSAAILIDTAQLRQSVTSRVVG